MVKFEPSNDMVSRGVFEQVMWERDVAIEQLKELGYELGQKVEPCDDAVSRQAVNTLIDELARAISDERCCISRGRSTATIMRDILHLPPVTPKTGHWMIDEDSTDWFFATYECSCCKRAIIVPHDAMKAVYKDYPYCHCGAKMQESEGV